jgi:hypothetical protein
MILPKSTSNPALAVAVTGTFDSKKSKNGIQSSGSAVFQKAMRPGALHNVSGNSWNCARALSLSASVWNERSVSLKEMACKPGKLTSLVSHTQPGRKLVVGNRSGLGYHAGTLHCIAYPACHDVCAPLYPVTVTYEMQIASS